MYLVKKRDKKQKGRAVSGYETEERERKQSYPRK
jgi:hypothetical protein